MKISEPNHYLLTITPAGPRFSLLASSRKPKLHVVSVDGAPCWRHEGANAQPPAIGTRKALQSTRRLAQHSTERCCHDHFGLTVLVVSLSETAQKKRYGAEDDPIAVTERRLPVDPVDSDERSVLASQILDDGTRA